MRLTVLGASASFPGPGDACSGYLVQEGNTTLLLDCGSGVLGRLQQFPSIEALSAIVISHFHPDHYIDLVALRYGLRYGFREPLRPRVLLPPGGIAFLRKVGSGRRDAPDMFDSSFALEEYDPSGETPVGPFSLAFQQTTHDVPTWACAVQGSRRLVYTADTQVSTDLEQFASGADLVLCEATYTDTGGILPSGNHLTAGQAGALAHRAGVPRLMLTHFWPGLDRQAFAAEAETTFGAPVTLAESGLVFDVATGEQDRSVTPLSAKAEFAEV
jgi:ribonuclease BN (tRNA processing enzyme)